MPKRLENGKKPRRSAKLQAYVTPEEYDQIVEISERTRLSLSEFARRVCLGIRIESREDQQARLELLRVNADLGRLGGLLKRALAEGHDKAAVIRLLRQIDQTQANLKEKVRAL
mgnify:CR=1 FL=1